MNCSMSVVWGILIITATIGMLLYNAHELETPEHRSIHWGGTQPCRSWRCVALEALRFPSPSRMGYVRVCTEYVCYVSVVLYCYCTCREIVNPEQTLSPSVS